MRLALHSSDRAAWPGAFLAFVWLFLGPCDAFAASYPFRVEAEQQGRFHLLQARNEGAAPVSVRVEVSGANLAGLDRWPQVSVVPPRSGATLGRIEASDPSAAYRFDFHYAFQVGDLHARHAPDFPYRLPFRDGEGYRVLQAPGGPITTHTDGRSTYAIDFDLPEGTPVVAARDGIVFEVVTGHTFGRLDPALKGMANHVGIVHADGTIAEYVHFRSGPYVVRPGQSVTAGTVIGYSGNTGYSSRPHLHFAVVRPVVREDGKLDAESVPVKFRFAGGSEPEPAQAGAVAVAGDPASVVSPVAPQASAPTERESSGTASFAEKADPRPSNTEVRDSSQGSPSNHDGQSAPDRPGRAGVSFQVPANLAQVPIWIWILAAAGVWAAAGVVARLFSRSGPANRVEPRMRSGRG